MDINETVPHEEILIDPAAQRRNLEDSQSAVQDRFDDNDGSTDPTTTLIEALEQTRLDPVKHLTENTSLHTAAETGNLEIVKFFIEELHVPVDRKGSYGETPLHKAARGGHLNVAKYLIEKKANINAGNGWGDTPLQLASYFGRSIDVVRYLVANKAASLNYSLLKAADENNLDIIECLRENGADVNFKCIGCSDYHYRDNSALHIAVRNNNRGLVQYLIENGADVSMKGPNSETPESIASKMGYTDLRDYLIEVLQNENSMEQHS